MKFVVTLLFMMLIYSSSLLGRVDPSQSWLQKESENFIIIYNAEQTQLGSYILQAAEKSYLVLKPIFKSLPEKTYIVLDSQSPFANGSASVFPYPLIRIQTAIPAYHSSIAGYGDWYYELVLHELVHIANLYPSPSYYGYLYNIFGSISRVNQMLPRWHTEGMAVAIESKLSYGGRLRSDFYEAYARALSIDGSWDEFKSRIELNETDLPDYPHGMRPYFFGSLFWWEMIREKDLNIAGDHTLEVASSLPLRHNAATETLTGKDEDEIFEQSYETVKKRVAKQLSKMKRFKQDKSLVLGDANLRNIMLNSQNSELFALRNRLGRDPEIFNLTKNKSVYSALGIAGFSFHPSQSKALVLELNTKKRFQQNFVLKELELKTGKARLISDKHNYSFASYSPTGKKIIASTEINGISRLHLISDDGKKQKTILNLNLGENILFPSWLSKNEVLYIKKATSGASSLFYRNLNSDTSSRVLGFLNQVNYLHIRNGEVFITSSHSGVRQAYQLSQDRSSYERIGFSETLVLDFVYDNQKKTLWSTELTKSGLHIFKTQNALLDSSEIKFENLYKLENQSFRDTDYSHLKPESVSEKSEYNSFQSLLPKYWLPFIYPYGEGTIYQITTTGTDPLGIHSYSLNLGYDTFTEKNNYSLLYTNRSTIWDLSVLHTEYYQNLLSAGSLIKRQSTGISAASYLFSDTQDWLVSYSLSSSFSDAAEEKRRDSLGAEVSLNKRSPMAPGALRPGGGYSLRSGLDYFPNSDKTIAFGIFSFDYSKFYTPSWNKEHRFSSSIKLDRRSTSSSDIYTALVSAGGNVGGVGVSRFHLNRGYPFSQFLAWSAFSLNLEYSLPAFRIYSGSDSLFTYLKDLYAGFVFDSSLLDGVYYNSTQKAFVRDRWDTGFHSIGAELHLNMKLAYLLPAKFTFGVYRGLNEKAGGQTRLNLLFSVPLL